MKALSNVYFVRSGTDGPIKIGATRRSIVANRVAELQIGSAESLRYLGHMRAEETHVHALFGHLRLSGEWFKPSEELLEFIRTNAIVSRTECKRERILSFRLPIALKEAIAEECDRVYKATQCRPKMSAMVRAILERDMKRRRRQSCKAEKRKHQ